jgi:hypothetical protein
VTSLYQSEIRISDFAFRISLAEETFVTCKFDVIYDSFIHLAVCLTTGPKPIPKRALYIVRSRASSFKWEYHLLSLRSSNSFLRLLPCLPVTFIPLCIFPSVTRCRRQFLRKMWPIQFAFRLRISCKIFLCSFMIVDINFLCREKSQVFHLER